MNENIGLWLWRYTSIVRRKLKFSGFKTDPGPSKITQIGSGEHEVSHALRAFLKKIHPKIKKISPRKGAVHELRHPHFLIFFYPTPSPTVSYPSSVAIPHYKLRHCERTSNPCPPFWKKSENREKAVDKIFKQAFSAF